MALVRPTVSSKYLYLPEGWDGAWKLAKAASSGTPAWMTVLGDSITQGAFATAWNTGGWYGLVRDNLIARGLIRHGDLWSPADSLDFISSYGGTPPFTVSATNRTWRNWGFGNAPTYTGAASEVVTFDTPYACTAMDFHTNNFAAGDLSYNIDAAGAVTITSTTDRWNKKTSVSGLANTTHQVKFSQASVTNAMALTGITTYANPSAGIGFARQAASGNPGYIYRINGSPVDMAAIWQGRTTSLTTGYGGPTQPALAIIALGINDCQSSFGFGPWEFYEVLRRLITAFRRGSPGCSILIIGYSNPDSVYCDLSSGLFTNPQHWPLYLDAMARASAAYRCAFVNIHAKWGATPVAQGFMTNGSAHPNDAGHADIANVLTPIL